MSYLNFISCATCHGADSKSLFHGLLGTSSSTLQNTDSETPFFSIPTDFSQLSYFQRFQKIMGEQIDSIPWDQFSKQQNWGLVFASTKGLIEDIVWQPSPPSMDPYYDLIKWLESYAPVSFQRSIVVSNACTSSHSAIELGNYWLEYENIDHVLVVAGDLIGPFTQKGFQTLRALSPSHQIKPFDQSRDGLLLGDGVASAILSNQPQLDSKIKINSVNTLCEGTSATRPDTSGRSLAKCFSSSEKIPDLILTHGTATHYNDLTEANAIHQTYARNTPPLITATKWAVGHTLGASGLIDLAIAEQVFENQKIPGIQTLENSDLPINEYLVRETTDHHVHKILISSLGFGGMCSSMEVSKEASP